MSEQQTHLDLEIGSSTASIGIPELRDEVAKVWSLPLGHRVEVSLRGNERGVITGVLELLSVPKYPWDPHEALRLRIAGLEFSSREIDHWISI